MWGPGGEEAGPSTEGRGQVQREAGPGGEGDLGPAGEGFQVGQSRWKASHGA